MISVPEFERARIFIPLLIINYRFKRRKENDFFHHKRHNIDPISISSIYPSPSPSPSLPHPKGHLFKPSLFPFPPLPPLVLPPKSIRRKKKKWKNSSPTKQNGPPKHQQAKEKRKKNKITANRSFQKVLFWVKMGNRTFPPFFFQFCPQWRRRVCVVV